MPEFTITLSNAALAKAEKAYGLSGGALLVRVRLVVKSNINQRLLLNARKELEKGKTVTLETFDFNE